MNKKIILGLAVLALIILGITVYFSGNKNGWSSQEVFLPEKQTSVIDCSISKNSEIKKDFTIKLADIKDKNEYKIKRQEAINLINQCYEVKLTEEYEVQAGEVSAQEGIFKNKISRDTRVFDKLKLFKGLDLFDYESVALDGGLTYVYAGDYGSLLNFYAEAMVDGYKQTPSPSEDELIWTDIETTLKLLTVKFSRLADGKTLANFDFVEPLDAAISQPVKTQTDLLLGRWVSLDDANSEIEFSVNKKMIDYYQGKKISEADFTVQGEKYLVAADKGEEFKYSITELSDKNLTLTYLSRGNTLRYKKIDSK